MRLKIPPLDLRSRKGIYPIEDEETGRIVGSFSFGRQRGRTVSLFDGKYHGKFDTEECCAFAKGVEAVLNHMVKVKE